VPIDAVHLGQARVARECRKAAVDGGPVARQIEKLDPAPKVQPPKHGHDRGAQAARAVEEYCHSWEHRSQGARKRDAGAGPAGVNLFLPAASSIQVPRCA